METDIEKTRFTDQEIDEDLMEAGYLCPDYSIHEWDLLEWKGDIRYMKCKKCGNNVPAMAKSK